jgi:NADPH2:quinone reductase
MKAALVREFGTAGTISIEDIDPPQPGADEVLLDVAACGVNFPDVLMIAGKYQVQPPMPFVPGIEISGRIREVGRNVRSLEIGQRVIAYASHGGLAEQAVVSADRVIPIPESISYTNAAAFAVAYGTSFHALRQRAQLAPGESLLVLGAAGGVGLAAVELGKLMGAHVIAAASDAEKLALAHSYGADELIDYRQADLRQSVRESTAGRGVDVVFDPVGGPMTEQCLRCLAWKGRLLIVGFAAGRQPAVAQGQLGGGRFLGRVHRTRAGRQQGQQCHSAGTPGAGGTAPAYLRHIPAQPGGAGGRHLGRAAGIGQSCRDYAVNSEL